MRSDRSLKTHNSYGKMPQYLLKRKEKWAEMERICEQENQEKSYPPGMMKMDESDRVETLRLLNDNEKRIRSEITHQPIAIKTVKSARRKEELECELNEILDAKDIFSREVVYIQKDS